MIPNTIKKYITYFVIIAIFILLAIFAIKKINTLANENDRLNNNIANINMEYQVSKTKNGELSYNVNSLTVKGNELAMLNLKLANSMNNLNLKLKNIQSISSIEYQYITLFDSIKTPAKINKLKYAYHKEDKYSTISGNINLPKDLFSLDSLIANNPKNYPYLSELKFINKDTLLVVPEFQYKRSWIFWKKVTGVKVHVKSSSPNFKLDRIEAFQIIK